MTTVIIMPQLGESVAEGIIGKWLKNEGDAIERDEPIVEVITDKVNAEIPSPVAGVLERISQPEGATVAVGQEIAVIGDGSAEVGTTSGTSTPATSGVPTASPSPSLSASSGNGQWKVQPGAPRGGTATLTQEALPRAERVRSSPLVRRLAEQHNISLSEVPGTGIGGRVSKHDILSFVEQRQLAPAGQVAFATETVKSPPQVERPVPQVSAPAPTPTAPPAPPQAPVASAPSPRVPSTGTRDLGSNEELVPVPPLRKMIAERMVHSVYTIPHATTNAEVDMTEVTRFRDAHKIDFRERTGAPLSLAAFVVKATVEALHEFPMVNAEWAGDSIIMKKDININVAVDAPEGLTTPVVHHADEKNLVGLSKSIYDLAIRGRNRKLTLADMQGGTFTVNNTGALGSVSGVSIINAPQAGILSCGAVIKRPVVVEQDGQDLIAVRHMMILSFTFDHRLLDGGYAVAFVNAVKAKLEGWRADYSLY